MKRNKGTLLLTSAVILLPILAGVLLWNRLPLRMATHWGLEGPANGWSGRGFTVFGLPLILLALHWLCVLITERDKGNRNQNRKVYGTVLWITPVTSVFICGIIYTAALERELKPELWTALFLGLLFLVIGNYMPKCRQNHTIGIKVKWTLESEPVWNATHRMAGKLWAAGGLMFLASVFLPGNGSLWAMVVILPVMVLVPVAYARKQYKKLEEAGETPTAKGKSPQDKKVLMLTLLVTVLILVGCAVLCFTGKIEVAYGETAFTVEASYYQDLTVEYAAVDHMEFREENVPGRRQFGFGSPHLLMGTFKNQEFGAYTRYSYTGRDACVVLQVGEEILVLGGKDRESSLAVYEELTRRCGLQE